MKRKDYQRPTMNVVKLQHTQMLMVSVESSQTSVQDYDVNSYYEE